MIFAILEVLGGAAAGFPAVDAPAPPSRPHSAATAEVAFERVRCAPSRLRFPWLPHPASWSGPGVDGPPPN